MTLSLSITHIIDNLMASSAMAHRHTAAKSPMLTLDNVPALTRLARSAFASACMVLSRTGRVKACDSGVSSGSDIMSVDVDLADTSLSGDALVAHLENAISFHILSICDRSDPSSANAFSALADDAARTVAMLISGTCRPGGARPTSTRSHWC